MRFLYIYKFVLFYTLLCLKYFLHLILKIIYFPRITNGCSERLFERKGLTIQEALCVKVSKEWRRIVRGRRR